MKTREIDRLAWGTDAGFYRLLPREVLMPADEADVRDILARARREKRSVTFRAAGADKAIKIMKETCPDMLVGAGTVTNTAQIDAVLAAGGDFIVSPGFDPELVAYAQEKKIPIFPGCTNASEYHQALKFGLEVIKFFPAEQAGGISYLKSVAPVFPLNFMPTGGVNTANLLDYLTFDRIASVGGTWMVKKDLINAGEFAKITAICKDAVKTMLGFEIRHVGINCADAAEAEKTARGIAALFGFEYKPGNSSDFAGEAVECMKSPYLGTNGHIAIGTNSVDRAVFHLSRRGIAFDESTRKTDAKTGRTKAIYLKGEFGGFAFHLVQK